MGNYTYGPLNVYQYAKEDVGLSIGNFCSIAEGVLFMLGGEHDYLKLSTYPFKAKFMGVDEATSKGGIIVEDDVWIGEKAIIMSGVKLKRGTVIAAGSVVTDPS